MKILSKGVYSTAYVAVFASGAMHIVSRLGSEREKTNVKLGRADKGETTCKPWKPGGGNGT